MNDLMSAGLHRYWKDLLVETTHVESMANYVRQRSYADKATLNLLDVAGGTGDVAFRWLEAAKCNERSRSTGRDQVQITVCDLNADMLRVGQERARQKYPSNNTGSLHDHHPMSSLAAAPSIGSDMNDGARSRVEESGAIKFVQGNAQDLPFEDNSFDVYTIAFGLRNVTDVDLALREACRVLKPGGHYLCLEFSQVTNDAFRAIYDTYSFNVIPAMGEYVANDRASYQYLVESIRQFSNQDELKQRMEDAGFQACQYTNLTGGIVAIHEGYKSL
jgi:ubiquinone/menaquinone biosynthesis methyltransferase